MPLFEVSNLMQGVMTDEGPADPSAACTALVTMKGFLYGMRRQHITARGARILPGCSAAFLNRMMETPNQA